MSNFDLGLGFGNGTKVELMVKCSTDWDFYETYAIRVVKVFDYLNEKLHFEKDW